MTTTHLTPERLAWKYRLLDIGETTEASDEFFNAGTVKWQQVGAEMGFTVSDCHAPVRRLCTDLPAAVEEITRLRAEVDKMSHWDEQWDLALSEHSEYEGDEAPWNTMRNEFKRRDDEIVTLRQQLAEAKGAWQKERDICQKAEAETFSANRRVVELEQQLAEANYKLLHCEAALQQANAASGEDTKRLDWLEQPQPHVVGLPLNPFRDVVHRMNDGLTLRAAIDAAMEGSRTK